MSDAAEFLAVALQAPFELDDTLQTFGARTVAAHRKILARYQGDREHSASSYGVVDPGVALWSDWAVRTLAEAYGWTPA